MSKELINRIKIFNEIKYGDSDNEPKIIIKRLKPEETWTTSPTYKKE